MKPICYAVALVAAYIAYFEYQRISEQFKHDLGLMELDLNFWFRWIWTRGLLPTLWPALKLISGYFAWLYVATFIVLDMISKDLR